MAQKKFVIVGGGTAGWMAAASLARLFSANPASCHEVVLVESEEIGTVGVGEATIPTILDLLSFLKIDLAEFVRDTNATMKLAIEFRDWRHRGHAYWHPFGTLGPTVENRPLFNYWLAREQTGKTGIGLMDLSIAVQLAENGHFAFPEDDPRSPLGGLRYALHFDATEVARFLRDYAEKHGARRVEGRVVDARLRSESEIRELRLSDGRILDGDFFIDCSGFRALLIERALGSPFEDWSAWLPCDCAFAAPTASEAILKPYTTSTALSSGWKWEIPLQTRKGNGYVFSSRFQSHEEALGEFRQSLSSEPLSDPRLLRFTAGMRREIWRGNCLSLGLSSGFLEPLESTSIHLVFINLFRFLDHFPSSGLDPQLIARFNTLAAIEMEEIRDFLVLHYCLTDREDSEFWRYMRRLPLPDSLAAKIELFRNTGRLMARHEDLFTPISWISVMHGMGLNPEETDPLVDLVPAQYIDNVMWHLAKGYRSAAQSAPQHAEFLARAGFLGSPQ